MSHSHLFPPAPGPLESSLPLSRHLSNAQSFSQEILSTMSTDPSSAFTMQASQLEFLVHQLPTHPDYSHSSNSSIIPKLRKLAHDGFNRLETLAKTLENSTINGETDKLMISSQLLDLFERISAAGYACVGILAGKITGQVSALVIPAQRISAREVELRYEVDVSQLLNVKGLRRMGIVQIIADEKPQRIDVDEGIFIALEQDNGDSRIRVYGNNGEEDENAADIAKDGPLFKLYDLRPLAIARDEQ